MIAHKAVYNYVEEKETLKAWVKGIKEYKIDTKKFKTFIQNISYEELKDYYTELNDYEDNVEPWIVSVVTSSVAYKYN